MLESFFLVSFAIAYVNETMSIMRVVIRVMTEKHKSKKDSDVYK